jgi:DNA-binding NtrC family response regulator
MSKIGSLLVLDDDADVLKAAAIALSPEAQGIDPISDPADTMAMLRDHAYDVLLLDMNFALGEHEGQAGLDLLEEVQVFDPTLSVVLMTSYGRVALAVETLKRGAVDFVLKPWRNAALIESLTIATALSRSRRAERDNLSLEVAEKQMIERALRRHDGNVSHAAAALGLTRWALARRMAKHGL